MAEFKEGSWYPVTIKVDGKEVSGNLIVTKVAEKAPATAMPAAKPEVVASLGDNGDPPGD